MYVYTCFPLPQFHEDANNDVKLQVTSVEAQWATTLKFQLRSYEGTLEASRKPHLQDRRNAGQVQQPDGGCSGCQAVRRHAGGEGYGKEESTTVVVH